MDMCVSIETVLIVTAAVLEISFKLKIEYTQVHTDSAMTICHLFYL